MQNRRHPGRTSLSLCDDSTLPQFVIPWTKDAHRSDQPNRIGAGYVPATAPLWAEDALTRGRARKIVGLCPSDPGTPSPMGLTRLSVPMIVGPLEEEAIHKEGRRYRRSGTEEYRPRNRLGLGGRSKAPWRGLLLASPRSRTARRSPRPRCSSARPAVFRFGGAVSR